MTTLKTISLVINDKVKSYSKIYASLIKDEFQRKRAYASLTALYALLEIFEKTDCTVQKAMTIFRNPELNEKYEISDFYVNDWHIDVRVITEGEAFLVPKAHFDNPITPDFYAVVKVDKTLETAELLGFADALNMKKDVSDYHYYSVSNQNLFDFDKLMEFVQHKKEYLFKAEEHEFFKENYLSLIDNEISEESKSKILKHLFECPECRTEFCCFTGFEMVNCNIGQYPEVLDDHTLNIIGAQDVDKNKYEGKEETIYIGDDNKDNSLESGDLNASLAENDNASNQADSETVSDILDELFNIEEDTVNLAQTSPENNYVNAEEEFQSDFEYINSDLPNDDDILSDDSVSDNNEFEMITDDDGDEMETLKNSDDLVLLDNNDVENSIEEENDLYEVKNDGEKVDKVIVDYDETGEPIYSYITNINSESENDLIEQIEDVEINEDLPEIEMEDTLPSQEDFFRPMSASQPNISHSAVEQENDSEIIDEPQEYVDDEITSEDIVDTPILEEPENSYPDEIVEEPIEHSEEYYNDEAQTEEPQLNEMETEEAADSISEKISEYDGDTEYNEDAEEYKEEDAEEDEDLENIGPEVKQKGSSKVGLLVTLLIVALSVPAALFATKYIKSATTDNNVTAQVPDQEATYDMFEQPDSQPAEGDLIPAGENAENVQQQDNNEMVPADENQNNQGNIDIPVSQPEPVKNLTEQDLVNQPSSSGDVNKVMADAFSQGGGAPVTINGVNWMCAPNLFTDKTFKSYLLGLDKVLKLNLNKNILNTVQQPTNSAVAVKLAIDNDGNLIRSQISGSSGSDEIDNIVLQSIKETLETQKTHILSDSEQKSDKYMLKVVIKL